MKPLLKLLLGGFALLAIPAQTIAANCHPAHTKGNICRVVHE